MSSVNNKISSLKILLEPLVTEKTVLLSRENKFVFCVKKETNKSCIKKVIQEIFDVKPISINVVNCKGKFKTRGLKRIKSKTTDFKKAIVTFKKGQKIDLFEQKV